MKTTAKIAGLTILGIGLIIVGYHQTDSSGWRFLKNPDTARQLKSFVAEKELESDDDTNPAPSEARRFLRAADRGDWQAVSNSYAELEEQTENPQSAIAQKISDALDKFSDWPVLGKVLLSLQGALNRPSPPGPPWWQGNRGEAMGEIHDVLEAFGEGGEKYPTQYANDIIQSIPPGSIYLPWTQPGHSVVAAMQKSSAQGDPFFTVSLQALRYPEYYHALYHDKIYIPTPDDSQRCYNEFMAEIPAKVQDGQGDSAETIWGINLLLAQIVFDKNTNREFYIEGFPYGWMCPYLEPHGLIFKLNRQPLPTLSDEIIQRDRDYWKSTTSPMIGDWLKDDTTASNIAAFAEKVFLRHDFNGFNGDTNFVQNAYAARMFSEDRVSIAELYAWRAHTRDELENLRMNEEADFAFRQAWALSPDGAAVFSYAKFLSDEGRTPEAILVAQTASHFHSDPSQSEMVANLITQLEQVEDTNFQKSVAP